MQIGLGLGLPIRQATGDNGTGAGVDNLLLEDGSNLLTEDGNVLKLE